MLRSQKTAIAQNFRVRKFPPTPSIQGRRWAAGRPARRRGYAPAAAHHDGWLDMLHCNMEAFWSRPIQVAMHHAGWSAACRKLSHMHHNEADAAGGHNVTLCGILDIRIHDQNPPMPLQCTYLHHIINGLSYAHTDQARRLLIYSCPDGHNMEAHMVIYGACAQDSETYFVGERDADNSPLFKHAVCVTMQSALLLATALHKMRGFDGLPIPEDFADK
jgi:hypothetical protein